MAEATNGFIITFWSCLDLITDVGVCTSDMDKCVIDANKNVFRDGATWRFFVWR